MSAADVLNGIDTAELPGNRCYLDFGDYNLEVNTFTVGRGRTGVGFAGVEFTVVGSSNERHPIGSKVHYTEVSTNEGWLGRVKLLLLAIVQNDGDVQPSDLSQDVIVQLVDKAGEKLKGYQVRALVTPRVTKNNKTVSRHNWYPAGKSEAAAARA